MSKIAKKHVILVQKYVKNDMKCKRLIVFCIKNASLGFNNILNIADLYKVKDASKNHIFLVYKKWFHCLLVLIILQFHHTYILVLNLKNVLPFLEMIMFFVFQNDY